MNLRIAAASLFTAISLIGPATVFGATSSKTVAPARNNVTAVYATVHQGDTLWQLASEHGATVSQLEQWNHLTDSSLLQLGSMLVVGLTSGGHPSSGSLSSRSDASALSSGTFGMQVVQYAEQFVGTPYQWGGESVSGFDCSGLVRFSYGHFGIGLGRSSYDQYQEGAAVSRSDLLPGDLVFFDAYGAGPSHVGIYVGGDRFVNAASGGVRIDSLDLSYWANHYLGARRVHN